MNQRAYSWALAGAIAFGSLSPALHAGSPPTSAPSTPGVRVDLPDGWVDKPPTVKSNKQLGANAALRCFFTLGFEARADFRDDLSLEEYAAKLDASAAKESKLAQRVKTDQKSETFGDREVFTYDVTGVLNDLKLHYRWVVFQTPHYFGHITFWSTPTSFDASSGEIEKLVAGIHE